MLTLEHTQYCLPYHKMTVTSRQDVGPQHFLCDGAGHRMHSSFQIRKCPSRAQMRMAIIGNDGCNSCSRTLLGRAMERFARCSPKVECFHCTLSDFKKIAFLKKKNMPWSRFNQAFEHQILDCHKFTNHPVVLPVERVVAWQSTVWNEEPSRSRRRSKER